MLNKKIVCSILAALPLIATVDAWVSMSIAQGNPVRRSVSKFKSDPVPADAIKSAVEAAILAPNHFLSEPTRMYNLGPETVQKLSALNEAKAKMFAGVPGWMMVTCKTEHLDDDGNISAKLALEDHATVACAAQNFMQSLAEDGIGSKWMTGALGVAPEDIMAAAGVADDEKFMGIIWYGFGDQGELGEMKIPKCKLAVDDVLTVVP